MPIVGGLRARYIAESIYQCVDEILTDLDWFQPGRYHIPLKLRKTPVKNDETIDYNTIVVFSESMYDLEDELGSLMAEHHWIFYVDIYAEDDAIGTHLAHDLRDALEGRMPSIGRTHPVVPVYDFGTATPYELFNVQLERVFVEKIHNIQKPWEQHWYSLVFDVVDRYANEVYG